jgi:hypothetical protein
MLDVRRQWKFHGKFITDEAQLTLHDVIPVPRSAHKFYRDFSESEIINAALTSDAEPESNHDKDERISK